MPSNNETPQLSTKQAQLLLRQFNYEKNEAIKATGTPEGRKHQDNARKLRQILTEYNRRQKALTAQRQASQSQAQQAQQAHQTLEVQQSQQIQAQQAAASQRTQSQGSSQPATTPTSQDSALQRITNMIKQTEAQIRQIEDKKSEQNLPLNVLSKLTEQEHKLKGQLPTYKQYAQQLSGRNSQAGSNSSAGSAMETRSRPQSYTPAPAAAPLVSAPAVVRQPSAATHAFDSGFSTGQAIIKPERIEADGDRVLSKRNLKGLVKYVAKDEGDSNLPMDADVEDLMLDLADEFVSSVTAFACRLAKHRKDETLDLKDIQLNLERNWNIRIPGYSGEEVKTTKRLERSGYPNKK